MAGVNQTVMLALSMVVIASMIGAPGLGRDVLSSLQRAEVGSGFVAGLSIVILAIIIDRFTQSSKTNNLGGISYEEQMACTRTYAFFSTSISSMWQWWLK